MGHAGLADITEICRAALAATPMFANADPAELGKLAACTSLIRLEAGEILFQRGDPGDSLYFVHSGSIRIGVLAADGREATYAVLTESHWFGEIAVLDNGPRTADATAMEPCTLVALEREHVVGYLKRNPELMMTMIGVLCSRIRKADELLADIFFLSLPSRLAKHLLVLGNTVGERVADQEIVLKVSQQEMADQIGIRRESVNRWLSKWEQAGLVGLWRGGITLRDLAALKALTKGR